MVGLSGVGKSTLLNSKSGVRSFLHVQASGLIKMEQAASGAGVDTSEALRLGPVVDNQKLLIAGFRRAVQNESRPVVFDGHTIIDGAAGIVEIGSDVFRQLHIRNMVVLTATPSEIARHRTRDVGRVRPFRTEEEIDNHQSRAVSVAKRIADDLNVELDIITQAQPDRLWELLESFRVSP